jgi:peroxiredoxin
VFTPDPRPVLFALLSLVIACGPGGETAEPDPAATPAAPAAKAEAKPAAATRDSGTRKERPLPAFGGLTFEGRQVQAGDFLGQRLVLFFFSPDDDRSHPAAQAMGALAPLQGPNNFRILGVASGASTSTSTALISDTNLEFPIVNDAGNAISKRFGLNVPAALLFVDAEGYVVGAITAVLEGADDPAAALEGRAREQLRLPPGGTALLEPALGDYPKAPDFDAVTLAGDDLKLSQFDGSPVVLIFFLHTCPHCHHAIEFLREQLPKLPEKGRPHLVGVSVSGSPSTVRGALKDKGYDFFPVVSDPDGSLRKAFGVAGGVPDILVLDSERRVRSRIQGWRDDLDPPIMRMRLATVAGQPVPMLLKQKGYSGNEVCGVCHENETATWRFTKHATAFDTLVKHNAERDGECVSCHVVGYDQQGGYSLAAPAPWFEGVGCETCHGRGGPHLSPGRVADHDYAAVCSTCHDPKHSLGFDYATFLPRVSHATNAHLLTLSPAEKRARVAALGSTRKPLFRDAAYVGSDACRSCHEQEFVTWEASPHGKAIHSLASEGKATNAECQACHATAVGKPGGMPSGADPAAHPDLARVGCESCHGPGADHVADGARRDGTILSLGDKCDSCVILQICGSCHDEANDPGFEFTVQEKIEKQRHGTIKPSVERNAPEALGPLAERIAAVEQALGAGGR